MHAHPVVWSFRVSWVVLAVIGGGGVSDALVGRSAGVRAVIGIGSFALWAAVLVASCVFHPLTLTVIRIVVPLALVLSAWALVAVDEVTALAVAGLVASIVALTLVFASPVADDFVDGASYGDERRFALRAPASLLLGPGVVVWALCVAGALAGPLLLAAQRWVPGALLTALGWPVAAWGARSLHLLARRWVVFVPAGMTLVDPITLVDSVLFTRARVAAVGPALTGSDARDLTAGAPGLALELRVTSPESLTVRTARSAGELVEASAVLFTPTRPAAVLDEARRRRLPVGVEGFPATGS